MWRPFSDLARRISGGSGSFKEYHGLFSVCGVLAGESSTRMWRVTVLIYIRHLYLTLGRHAVPSGWPLWWSSCSQTGKAGQQTVFGQRCNFWQLLSFERCPVTSQLPLALALFHSVLQPHTCNNLAAVIWGNKALRTPSPRVFCPYSNFLKACVFTALG